MKDWFKSPRLKKMLATGAVIFVLVLALSVLLLDGASILMAVPHSLIFTAAIVYCIFKFIPSLKAQYQGFKERRRHAVQEQEQWEKEFEQSFEERVAEGKDVEMAVDPMPSPPPPTYEGAGVFEKGGADLLHKLEESKAKQGQKKEGAPKRRPQDSFAYLKEEAQEAHVQSLKKQQGKEIITTPMIILCTLKSADGFMLYAFSLEYKIPLRLRSVCRPSGAFIQAEILTDRKDEAPSCALDLVGVPVSTSFRKLSFYDEAAVVPGIKWHYVQTLTPQDLEKCLAGHGRDLILDDETPYLLKEEATDKLLHEHISLIKVDNFSFGPQGGAFDYEGRHFEGFGGRLGRCSYKSALLLTALEEHEQYYIKSVNAVFPLAAAQDPAAPHP